MLEMALVVCLVVIFGLCQYIADLRWWVKYLRRERERTEKFSNDLIEKFTGVKVAPEKESGEVDWSDDTLNV